MNKRLSNAVFEAVFCRISLNVSLNRIESRNAMHDAGRELKVSWFFVVYSFGIMANIFLRSKKENGLYVVIYFLSRLVQSAMALPVPKGTRSDILEEGYKTVFIISV